MANKMLIDATHPEETRVVVLRGNRVEEFDFESASRKQLRGNIYLAKVTRVEPSLQAAFVDYGGNRHGFLAFSEIHPDYYQIPVADRQALLDEERRHRDDEEETNGNGNGNGNGGGRRRRHRHRRRGAERNRSRDVVRGDAPAGENAGETLTDAAHADEMHGEAHAIETFASEQPIAETAAHEAAGVDHQAAPMEHEPAAQVDIAASSENTLADILPTSEEVPLPPEAEPLVAHAPEFESKLESKSESKSDFFTDLPTSEEVPLPLESAPFIAEAASQDMSDEDTSEEEEEEEASEESVAVSADVAASEDRNGEQGDDEENGDDEDEDDEEEEDVVESIGGDGLEEVQERTQRYRRHYKIQEVIKRRQVMLVQVVKEERGTKGAALTTYLSLAGRYSVLMPNTARGGGISRKVTSAEDRRKMKEVAEELDVPEGMGVILRTAGASRTKAEIKRDFEYLLRLWENIRDLTLKSTAPTLVYEEGSLVKRSIRDLYHKDIDDIIVEGEPAFREAKDFMRMLMPSHSRHVHLYQDAQPIFARFGIEPQLDAMFTSTVQLKSGGYIVINQTEALVAIDVNSGRATREHSIEETALKTNSEAAVEIARQLRLRDLAGLIVIDFIDMDENRNNRSVERKVKDALKSDRARIQVGRISHFGLLEMSRQRIRSSVLENSTEVCPQCGGIGHVRSVSSVALQLVRALEETLLKGATHNLIARTRSDVAIYVLNHKRAHLRMLEERFKVAITITADHTLSGHPPFAIDRGEQVMTLEQAKALVTIKPDSVLPYAEEEEEDEIVAEEIEENTESDGEAAETDAEDASSDPRRGRRRRRGRRGRGARGDQEQPSAAAQEAESSEDESVDTGDQPIEIQAENAEDQAVEETADGELEQDEGNGRRRRRGRRGGRRSRRSDHAQSPDGGDQDAEDTSADTPQIVDSHIESELEAEPEPAAATAQQQPEQEDEKPRRRSTVREPAPSFETGNDAPPVSTPAPIAAAIPEDATTLPEEETAEPAKPRRFGWWSRR